MSDENNPTEFREFPKLARLSRECIITEKIDGTNAQLLILPRSEVTQEYLDAAPDPFVSVSDETGDYLMLAGSRNRWISAASDNQGFAGWVSRNRQELVKLGPGRHFGEWWGNGIQRRYGLKEKRWSLFNVVRWEAEGLPSCCSLVPVLFRGVFTTEDCEKALTTLREGGSVAAPGFMDPEGIVCFHVAANSGFKKTLNNDAIPKSLQH